MHLLWPYRTVAWFVEVVVSVETATITFQDSSMVCGCSGGS